MSYKIGEPIDMNFSPRRGDILLNKEHPLTLIEYYYLTDDSSLKVNKNFNKELLRHELLIKIIRRKEIIWGQVKYDLKHFPENNSNGYTAYRKNISYSTYCYYNNPKQFKRLYGSRYRSLPSQKIKIINGKKMKVILDHSFCRKMDGKGLFCSYRHNRKNLPLTTLVKQNYIYGGNIYDYIILVKDQINH